MVQNRGGRTSPSFKNEIKVFLSFFSLFLYERQEIKEGIKLDGKSLESVEVKFNNFFKKSQTIYLARN